MLIQIVCCKCPASARNSCSEKNDRNVCYGQTDRRADRDALKSKKNIHSILLRSRVKKKTP